MKKLRLAVLISGSGSTLDNLLRRIDQDKIAAEVVLVISSKADAGGLQFAAQRDIPIEIIQRSVFENALEFCTANFLAIAQHSIDLVVMGGYLQHLLIPEDFENRVINIHPSLIPAFCGKGFYGLRVHQAAIDFGVKISGCTVHFVDDQYDHGPIIAQASCEVFADDKAEDLQQRVGQLERDLLPKVIASFVE